MDARERAGERLTVAEAFAAVGELVQIYWQTGGKAENEIAAFGGSLAVNPALWDDWLTAIDRVRG